jgi:hypothetical protein
MLCSGPVLQLLTRRPQHGLLHLFSKPRGARCAEGGGWLGSILVVVWGLLQTHTPHGVSVMACLSVGGVAVELLYRCDGPSADLTRCGCASSHTCARVCLGMCCRPLLPELLATAGLRAQQHPRTQQARGCMATFWLLGRQFCTHSHTWHVVQRQGDALGLQPSRGVRVCCAHVRGAACCVVGAGAVAGGVLCF